MSTRVFPRRAAGVFLPISALPSHGPIGDVGPAAYRFVDWLRRARQRYWQILPLSIPDAQGSPYASPSSMAGNWMYVNAELLRKAKLLPSDVTAQRISSRVEYRLAAKTKWRMIRTSWKYFQAYGTPEQHRNFVTFRRSAADWLTDFTLYQAIKDRHRHRPWWRWPATWRHPILARAHVDAGVRRRMDIHAYAQWLFFWQWQELHTYARKQGIALIGDLPFYVQDDSVETWTQPGLFSLDRHGRPQAVAGVPPDNFSRTGQRWGQPVYRWSRHRRQHFGWWVKRVQHLQAQVDVVRFDHFQGLAETFHIPVRSRDGRHGRWVKTPGHKLIQAIMRGNPKLRLVAEDIGHPEPDAEHLRRHYRLPGIRMLEFGWSGLPANFHHPKYLMEDCLYCTSSHDTLPFRGWWQEAEWWERKNFREWAGPSTTQIAWHGIEAAYRSRARVVMVPVVDLLELGESGRLNRPGRVRGNWVWRLRSNQLKSTHAQRLRRLTESTRR